MDTNKNWVNWKKYDANSRFSFVTTSIHSTPVNISSYTFANTGLYIAFATGYQTSNCFTVINSTSAQFTPIHHVEGTGSNRRCLSILFFNAISGDTVSLTASATSGTKINIFYIGTGISAVSTMQIRAVGDTSLSTSVSESTKNTVVIAAAVDRAITGISINSSNSTDYATDGAYYGCWTNFYTDSSCTVDVNSGKGNGTAAFAVLQLS